MARKVRPEDLSEQELRRLMVDKKRQTRQQRLDAFRRSGRLMDVGPIQEGRASTVLDDFIVEDAPDQPVSEAALKQERRKRRKDFDEAAQSKRSVETMVEILQQAKTNSRDSD